jgi:hypothetical protein
MSSTSAAKSRIYFTVSGVEVTVTANVCPLLPTTMRALQVPGNAGVTVNVPEVNPDVVSWMDATPPPSHVSFVRLISPGATPDTTTVCENDAPIPTNETAVGLTVKVAVNGAVAEPFTPFPPQPPTVMEAMTRPALAISLSHRVLSTIKLDF